MKLDKINFLYYLHQIENPENFLPNRYLVNKITVVLSNILKDDRFKKDPRLIEIYNQLSEIDEPYDLFDGMLKDENNLIEVLNLYDEVIVLLRNLSDEVFG